MRLKRILEKWIEPEELPTLVAAAMVGCAAAALVCRTLFVQHGVIPGDFETYLGQWQLARQGELPYRMASAWSFSPGVLALARFLPEDPVRAWQVFGGLSILALGCALLLCVRYRNLRTSGKMVLGLGLAWKGILDTMDRGGPEMIVLGLAAAAAAVFEVAPVLSGLLLGFLPGFKLFWMLLFIPFALAARTQARRRTHRFRRFFTGYLAGFFIWASALPSLTFGRDQALKLSQAWVQALREQPALLGSETNQSIWAVSLKLGLPPLVALGVASVLAGAVLGRLVVRSQETASGRISRSQALGWMSPWLLYVQWVSPVAWQWGSIFAVGMPLAWERTLGQHSRMLRWTCGMWIGFFWALQQSSFLKFFGIQDASALASFGVFSFYWLVLLALF